MSAQEIVDELLAGRTVAILADDAFLFMREVERHGLKVPQSGISMQVENGQCFMTIGKAGSNNVDYPAKDSQRRLADDLRS